MKKMLSILSIISITTITINVIACKQKNTINKPIEPQFIPQQPPKNSNWKLIDNSLNNIKTEFKNYNDKWYFIIWKKESNLVWEYQSMFFKYNESAPRMTGAWISSISSIYKWNEINKPTTPTIDEKTGEITDWKKIILTKNI